MDAPYQRVSLSSPFILAGSEAVSVDGVLFSDDLYEINYQRGIIRFTAPMREGAVVSVSYTRLPFLLDSVYSLRHIEFSKPEELVPQRVPRLGKEEQLVPPSGDLIFGGMKSISLSVGTNKSSSLDQSLRATVEGNITSTIKVRALLSDNNLPIQPQGNTEELEYLDKVFVEFTGPHGKATLGDFTYGNRFSTFSQFQRELKGVSGEVAGFDTRVGIAGGSSKGVFRSLQFRGIEQMQGPYDLLPGGRNLGEVVIAGTERVYFDGTILQRGHNRDYTIDYDRGSITFTPKRLVTADSEIGIEFEVTQQQYDRTSAFGTVQSELGGGFRFEALVARERDDDGRPKSTTLDDDDREILSEAGDHTDSAIASGIAFVGTGEGDYELVAADSATGIPEHFVFNDSTGAYDLAFVEVGNGKGDYVLDGISVKGTPIYDFAGDSLGNYVVGRMLPMPQSQSIITTRLVRGGTGRFHADFEYNISDLDRNTLSALDNEDNVGDAGKFVLGINKIPVRVGQLDFKGSLSTIEENFRGFGSTRPWYFYTDWNLEGVRIKGREFLQELTTAFSSTERLKLQYDLGQIRRDDFSGVKQEGRIGVGVPGDRSLTGRAFLTDVNGDDEERTRKHATASLSYGIWAFLPTLTYSADEFLKASPADADSGFAYEHYTVGVSRRNKDRFGYTVEASERNTDQLADTTGGWLSTRRDRTYRLSLFARGTPVVEGGLHYSHRIQNNWLLGDKQTSDLARINGLLRITRLGFRTSFDYEISQNSVRRVEKSVVFVGEGKGNYNQLGEPVGDGRGDYTLVILPDAGTIPTRNVGLTLRTNWGKPNGRAAQPLNSGIFSWIASNVSLEQQFTLREATTLEDGYKVYLLFPSALQRNDATVHGVVSLQQDWSLLNGYPTLSLNFRYQRDDEEDNRFAPVKEDKLFEQHLVTLDKSISQLLSATAEVRREKRKRGGAGFVAGTGSTYDVAGWAFRGGWGLRFSAGSTLDGHVEYSRRSDAESGALEKSWSFRPRFVWRVRKSLSLFGRYEFTRFSGSDKTRVRPFFFSNAGSSQRWSSTLNIKVSRIISFLTTYQGRSEDTFAGKRIVEHDFKVETRAFF